MNLLIFEAEFKRLAPVSHNLSNVVGFPQVALQVTDLKLRPILCDDLVDELILQKNNNTLTPDNVALMEYVTPYLAWWILNEFLLFSYAKIREQGVVNQVGDSGATASEPILGQLIKNAQSNGIGYESRLRNFVTKNIANYPLLQSCACYCTAGQLQLPFMII